MSRLRMVLIRIWKSGIMPMFGNSSKRNRRWRGRQLIRAMVCGMHQNLKALLEHDRRQKVVGCGGVGRDNRTAPSFCSLASSPQVNGIVRADLGMMDGMLNALMRSPERHIDALCGLVREPCGRASYWRCCEGRSGLFDSSGHQYSRSSWLASLLGPSPCDSSIRSKRP